MKRILQSIRKNFIAGVIVILPLFATGYISWWLINLFDELFKPLVPIFLPGGADIPGIGIVVTLVLTVLIGAIASNFFGKTIIGFGESILNKMPVVRNIYRGLKQIVETVLSKDKASFKKVALIEYPRKDIYSIVFVANQTYQYIRERIDTERKEEKKIEFTKYTNVFLPTTPNPTSGYMLIVPTKDLIILEISFEEAAKLVISGGIIDPVAIQKNKKKIS